ncbi:hypothetical protein HK104_002545 [Borealophlyctis nickersoniae]|nr:hypothetical protein HK104_002545 [Borealophlyctis nickersoniae]
MGCGASKHSNKQVAPASPAAANEKEEARTSHLRKLPSTETTVVSGNKLVPPVETPRPEQETTTTTAKNDVAPISETADATDEGRGEDSGVLPVEPQSSVRVASKTIPPGSDGLDDQDRKLVNVSPPAPADNVQGDEQALCPSAVANESAGPSVDVAVPPKSLVDWKHNHIVRIFVSTAPEMVKERHVLFNVVAPIVRKVGKEVGVRVMFIDPRFGLPADEPTTPSTLSVILQAIDSCLPFFIGILGHRYGWIPEISNPSHVSAGTLHQFPWLVEWKDKSFLEIEVCYGIRGGAGAAVYVPSGNADEVVDEVHAEFSSVRDESPEDAREDRERLEALKRRVLSDGKITTHAFTNVSELGDKVVADLSMQLRNRVSKEVGNGWEAVCDELAPHHAYAEARRKMFVSSVRTEGVFAELDDYANTADEAGALIVTGPAGRGKSTLLANWVQRRAELIEGNKTEFIISHFTGASWTASDAAQLVSLLIQQFTLLNSSMTHSHPQRTSRLPSVASTTSLSDPSFRTNVRILHDLFYTLSATLTKTNQTLLVVLDGLDNMSEDLSGAHELVWIPARIPEGIKLIISATDECLVVREGRNRGEWMQLEVEGVGEGERVAMVERFCGGGRKVGEMIAVADQSADPLYVKLMGEAIRLRRASGVGDEEGMVKELLEGGIPCLLVHLLSKLEAMFADVGIPGFNDRAADAGLKFGHHVEEGEEDGVNVVAALMTVLWVAKTGLCEARVVSILQIPHVHWCALLQALGDLIIFSSGTVELFHPLMRSSIESRYLPMKKDRQAAYNLLAKALLEEADGTGKEGGGELDTELAKAIICALDGASQKEELIAFLGRPDLPSSCLHELGIEPNET